MSAPLLIALAALCISAASLALSLWSLKLSRDAEFNMRVLSDDDFRRAHAERSAREIVREEVARAISQTLQRPKL